MKEYIHILEKVKLFAGITSEDIEKILGCLNPSIESYEKGDFIYNQGDRVENIAIILEGNLHIIEEDYNGNRAIISNIGQAQIFGEVFVFSEIESIPISVYALDRTKVLFIAGDMILKSCSNICDFHNKLVFNMMHILAEKNLILNEKVRLISRPSIREKTLSYLYREARENKSKTFTIDYNRQELADYLSVNRSALSRELSRLRDEGLIDYRKNKFKINI